jgi:transposase
MPTILCVGGDTRSDQEELHLCALDQTDGHEVGKHLTVSNNRPGAEQTIAHLVGLMTQHGYTQLHFGLEATGLFWLPFFRYLQQSAALTLFHPTWVCFNPKLVAKFKEGVSLSEIKDDDHDAHAVAERLRFGRLPVTYVPSNEWLALRVLTRYRYRLSRQIAQEKQRALTRVFLKASEWQRGQPFSDVWGATSATLLSEFTVAEIAAMTLPQLTNLIQEYGRKHFDDPQATARHLQRTLQNSFPVAPELDAALTVVLRVAWTHIRDLEKLMHRLDREIAQRMERIPNPLLSVQGLGAVITAGIAAEIADIQRFPGDPQLAKFVGLVWRKHASGQFTAEETCLAKTGNVYLRYYLIEGANHMRQHNLEYQAYYSRKYDEVPKHQHKRALVLTARKLVRLVYALLTKNQNYVRPQAVQSQEATPVQ